jgi:hypothetical protein
VLRQHHDTDLGVFGMDGPGGLDALHVVTGRHSDIGQHSVRAESAYRIEQLARITNTGYDLDLPGVFQQTAYAFADQIVVFCDDGPEYLRHHWLTALTASGSSARTLVPAPGRLSIVSRPCSAPTRSRMLANPPERAPFDSNP